MDYWEGIIQAVFDSRLFQIKSHFNIVQRKYKCKYLEMLLLDMLITASCNGQ
jgi:hypothetical protein